MKEHNNLQETSVDSELFLYNLLIFEAVLRSEALFESMSVWYSFEDTIEMHGMIGW